MTYGFIGTGNMGGALARALAKTVSAEDIYLSNRTVAKARSLAQELGARVSDNKTIITTCDTVFLGVKPQMMAEVLSALQGDLSARREKPLLVSMAAGLTLSAFSEMAAGEIPILRIMPNTACAVGEGMATYCANALVTSAQLQRFLTDMAAAGQFDPIAEELMDAASAVAGCGGAYACLFLEALADGGVLCGLPRDKARKYAAQMLLGTARLALTGEEHTAAMKDAICSPGGTTIAGVRALEAGGFRSAAMEAVIAACEKTKQLTK